MEQSRFHFISVRGDELPLSWKAITAQLSDDPTASESEHT
jgi:hypothetical protein